MMNEEFNNRLEGIRVKFVASLAGKVEEFETLMERIISDDDAAEALEELRLGVHKLRGVAPTLGLQKLGSFAAESEDSIIAMTNGGDPNQTAGAFLGAFRALVAEMREAADS